VARARAGDSAAFAEILREHQAMVFSIAHHFIGNRATAEEIAQEVFLKLHRHLNRVESGAHLTFWLRQVTSRSCIDWFRRNRIEETSLDDAVGASEIAADAPPILTRDFLLEERIRQLVAELPSRARLVVTLRYQEDLDVSDIAAILDMPVNTVKSHLRRSVELLRNRLIDCGGSR
jgi:RNA polymerase sigma-70 factor (ECF subfamily)